MPFGMLKTKQTASGIPLCSPPYPATVDEFSDIDALSIRYYTPYDAVKDLIPEELELQEEVLVNLTLYKYGFSPIGAYTEFVALIETKLKGSIFYFQLQLILDNEGAIFSGREKYGIPKVFGNVIFDPSATKPAPSGFVSGHVERPLGSKLVQFSFKPQKKVQPLGPINRPPTYSLALRSIPSGNPDDRPVLREFIPIHLEFIEAEVWSGEGSVGLFNVSEFDPIHKLRVIRYDGATLFRHGSAILHPVTRTIPI
jgi:acetoacetate decarboxylase